MHSPGWIEFNNATMFKGLEKHDRFILSSFLLETAIHDVASKVKSDKLHLY